MNKSEFRDPASLRPHSILSHIPAPATDAPEIIAAANAIREQDGILLPIVVDPSGHILTDDSRLRWLAARRMGLKEVPVTVMLERNAPVHALNALLHRAHYTKSALAYLAVPFLKPAFESAKAHRHDCLKKGQTPVVHSVDYGKTWEELAFRLGISRSLLAAAQQVRAEFEKDRKKYSFPVVGGPDDGAEVLETIEEHFEPKLLRAQQGDEQEGTRPIGLGGVMKAIGSIRATKGVPRPTSGQLELFADGLDTLRNRFACWEKLNTTEKRSVEPKLDEFFDAMSPELLQLAHAKIKARLKAVSAAD